MLQCNIFLNNSPRQHLSLSIGDGNGAARWLGDQIMQTNQKVGRADHAARSVEGQAFPRTRAALVNAARSARMRQQVARELSLLSDRALADLGIYRSDIRGFARNASRIADAESVVAALAADLKGLFGFHGTAAGRPV